MQVSHRITLVSLFTVLALPRTGVAQLASVEERSVMQAIDRLNTAYQQRDGKAYESLTAPDFVRVVPNGRAFVRADWLKTVVAPGAPRSPARFDQTSVRVYGNAALVTYRSGPNPSTNEIGGTWMTRILVKYGAEWKQAFAQSTDTARPAAPSDLPPVPLPARPATTPAEREVLEVYQAIQKANRAGDVAAWEKLSAPDHRIINDDGTTMTRAERVAQIKKDGGIDLRPDQDLRVAVKGDLAFVTTGDSASRTLKVLARRNGQWQQVLNQITPVVPAK